MPSVSLFRKLRVRTGDTFNVGEAVRKAGLYICVPCGRKQRFSEGEIFPRCFSCLEGETYNGDAYMKNLGLWELL